MRRTRLAIIALATSMAAVVVAQEPPPVLHEFFVIEGDELAAEPVGVGDNGVAQPIYSSRGAEHPTGDHPNRPGARNAPESGGDDLRLDRDTDMEGWLTYYAVFDPTVAPFKRGGARDRVEIVEGEVALVVGEPALEPLRIVDPEPAPEAQVFWGSLLVELQPGLLVPIPSVAPNMTIHRVQVDPPVSVRFYKDGADNFMVGGDHAGVVQLDLLVSAPTSYFAGPLPAAGALADIAVEDRPPVPEAVREPAGELFALLGLSEQMTVTEVVWHLAGHFRAFIAEPFPREEWSDDVYRDILFGGRGVCRHRAFAFVVTLQSWGIAARYLYNEAHAFAEVFIPGNGWRRIDLGGGAQGLHVLNAASRVVHAHAEPDAFPMPPQYVENYSVQARDALATREIERADDPPSDERSGDSDEDPIDMPPWDPFEEYSATLEEFSRIGSTDDDARDGASSNPMARRGRATIDIGAVEREVFRGGTLQIEARIVDEWGGGLSAKPVRVYIGPSGSRWAIRVVDLGTLRSGEDGIISGSLAVPHSLPLGVWDVYLVFAGDADHAPTRAR